MSEKLAPDAVYLRPAFSHGSFKTYNDYFVKRIIQNAEGGKITSGDRKTKAIKLSFIALLKAPHVSHLR